MRIDDNNNQNIINEITASGETAIMVFEKEWSGACQLLEPILAKLSDTFENSLRIIRVNIELNPELAINYSINQVPTILFIKDGILQDTIIGLMPFDLLKNKIKAILVKSK